MRVTMVAKQLGVSADWLRRLERLGRIPRALRDMNGYRRYLQADVERLRQIIFPCDDKAQ
jgi:DNA-binding transcriptional MerR regulator